MYLASQRKEFILKTLAEHGAARTIALAKQMKVTDETVRNDLINLEKRGFLKRVHGGALALTHKSLHEDIVTQDDVSIRIAKKTVQNIPASVVMFIDSSTMGYQICNHINSKDTHVVSNNPTLLTRLEGIPNLSFYCTGGHFDREALVYVGQDAAKAAGSLSIDMVVLTPDCYSPQAWRRIQEHVAIRIHQERHPRGCQGNHRHALHQRSEQPGILYRCALPGFHAHH